MAYKFQLGTAKLSGSIQSVSDDEHSLGAVGNEFKDLFLDGTANIDSLVADSADINGGNIDGTIIGASSVAAGSFAALDATGLDINGVGDVSDTLTLSKGSGNALVVNAGGAVDFNGNLDVAGTSTLATVDINAGAIDNTVIGASTAAAGTFTTLNGSVITASTAFTGSISGSLIQGDMANFGGGGLSTSDGGNVQSDGDLSGSVNLLVGGTVRLDGVTALSSVNVDLTSDSFYFLDASGDLMRRVAMTDYASKIAGNAIVSTNGVLAVNPDAAGGLEIRSGFDSLQIKAGGVTNAMLAGSIANGKLANSSVSYGGVSLSLGQSDATPAFDLSDATSYPGDSSLVTAGALAAGSIATGFGTISTANNISTTKTGSFGKVVVSGDLIVQGTTTQIDSTQILVTGSIQFEGATGDAHETTLGVVDPTADRSILLPNAAGNLAVFSDSSFQSAASAITLTELNVLDGGTSDSGVTIAGTDQIIINDAGSMLQTAMSDVATFVGQNIAEKITTASGTHNHVFATHGSILIADASGGAVTINLPAIASGNDGKILKIKKVGSNSVTINRGGSDQIDGLNSISLDSDAAAISLVFDDTNNTYHVM